MDTNEIMENSNEEIESMEACEDSCEFETTVGQEVDPALVGLVLAGVAAAGYGIGKGAEALLKKTHIPEKVDAAKAKFKEKRAEQKAAKEAKKQAKLEAHKSETPDQNNPDSSKPENKSTNRR